jgi:thioredoxin 1
MFKFASTAPVVREVEHADDGSFAQTVLQSDQPVLVDFYADWCGPCRRLAPVLEDVAQEVPDARVVKVNVDHAPSVARKYKISSIPALIVFRNGQPVANHTGVASKSKLKQMLQQ